MAKEVVADVPQHAPRSYNVLTRVAARITGDDLNTSSSSVEQTQYPWTFADATKKPIGSMFEAEITPEMLNDMYQRYQLAKRIIDSPVEEAFAAGFSIKKKNGDPADQKVIDDCMKLWEEYDSKWSRFFKMERLYGRCEMIFGWTDPRETWGELPPATNSTYTWLLPVPVGNEIELKVSDTIPIVIKYLDVNFGAANLRLHRSRFIFSMNPKLVEEDKEGISILAPIYNLLQVQIHADWSIGQALFRRASGLLGIYAPKGNISDDQRNGAIASVSNHNSKTALYVPFGWNIKDILKPGGNLAIARTYKVVIEQIAAGSGFPISILIGQQKSSLNMSGEDMEVYTRTVKSFQENTMAPTLQKFFRISQKFGKIEPGELIVVPNSLITKDPYMIEKEETIIGVMRLLKARLDLATDETGKIVDPLARGLPDNAECIKIIGAFKDKK